MRRYFLPSHARIGETARDHRLRRYLHACGNLSSIMEDLIESVGIDGKHSFEDAIEPVEDFHRRYHTRIASLGGVDVDILARGTVEDVRRRTREVIDACAPLGRFAVGSGNSIPNYIPLENYLAMLDEARLGA
jgi:uroporphyrinogen decarboxylase